MLAAFLRNTNCHAIRIAIFTLLRINNSETIILKLFTLSESVLDVIILDCHMPRIFIRITSSEDQSTLSSLYFQNLSMKSFIKIPKLSSSD